MIVVIVLKDWWRPVLDDATVQEIDWEAAMLAEGELEMGASRRSSQRWAGPCKRPRPTGSSPE